MSVVKCVIGGDLFPRKNEDKFIRKEIHDLFESEIIDLFRKADFSVCNLEGTLTNFTDKIPKRGPSIRAVPDVVNGIKALGINYLSLANNHAGDYGEVGFRDTIRTLQANDIGCFGCPDECSVNNYLLIDKNGIKIILYGVAEIGFFIPGNINVKTNFYDEYRVCNELNLLKEKCDYLIVLYHGGLEYFQYPTSKLVKRFHRMADCGADVVIAQHTHCIGTEEFYNGAYLLYGQGNFYFHQKLKPELTKNGLLLEFHFTEKDFTIKHHLVQLDENICRYEPSVKLTDFYTRSEKYKIGETFAKEYSEYCDEWMFEWIMHFRGFNPIDKVMKRILNKKGFQHYLRKSYKNGSVINMFAHIYGEQDAETIIQGLRDFYNYH